MRKLIFQMLISVDGYFEGPKQEIDWHNVDQEFNAYATEALHSLDMLLFGRVTYELMANYWPTPKAREDDPIVAERMNHLPKIVFSRTLAKVEWENTRLIKDNIGMEVLKLKQQRGKDLAIFGSSDLAVFLTHLGLIDEYRIFVDPIILGGGKTLLTGIQGRQQLKLIKTRVFANGNVLLCYEPVKK